MPSPHITDSTRSFNIHRELDVSGSYAKLTETIDDEGCKIKRSIVVPSPKQKPPKQRKPLSERQSRAEIEAYRTFQMETGQRRHSDPPRPDKRKLKRISQAEEKLKKDQERIAQAMRQSQREISMIAAQEQNDDIDDDLFKEYTERLKQKLAPKVRPQESYISPRDLDREIAKAEAAIRDEQELQQVMDNIDDYYYNVGTELEDLRLKSMQTRTKGLEDLHEWIHDEKEYEEGKEFLEAETQAEVDRVEKLIESVNAKLPVHRRLNFSGPNENIFEPSTPQVEPVQRARVDQVPEPLLERKPRSTKEGSKIPSFRPRTTESGLELMTGELSSLAKDNLRVQKATQNDDETPRRKSRLRLPRIRATNATTQQNLLKPPPARATQQITPGEIHTRVSAVGHSSGAGPSRLQVPVNIPPGGTIKSPKAGPSGLQRQTRTHILSGVSFQTPKQPGTTLKSREYELSGTRQILAPRVLRSSPERPADLIEEMPRKPAVKGLEVIDAKRKLKEDYVEAMQQARDNIKHDDELANYLAYLSSQYYAKLQAIVTQGRRKFTAKRPQPEAIQFEPIKFKPTILARQMSSSMLPPGRDLSRKLSSRLSLGSKSKPSLPAIPEQQARTSRIPARTASQKYLTGTDATRLKSRAKQDYQAALSAIKDQSTSDKEIAQRIIYLKKEFRVKISLISKLEDQKLAAKSKYLQDCEVAKRTIGDPDELRQNLAGLKKNLVEDLNELNKAAGEQEETGPINDREISAQVARRERQAKVILEQRQARKEEATRAAFQARTAERVAAVRQSIAEAARTSVSKSVLSARRKILDPASLPQKTPFQTPAPSAQRVADAKKLAASASRASLAKTPRSRAPATPSVSRPSLPPQLAARSAAAQRVAAAKAAAASASRASLAKTPRSRAPATPSVSRPSLPPQITARSAAAQRVAAAKAAAASASRASLAKTPRSRAPVTPSTSRPSLPPQLAARSAAAQRVAAAKAAAASASRASLAKTPRSRAPVTPSASRPSLPPQITARSAAAQRVAAAKAAAASASRASLAKTPRSRAPATPSVSRPSLPPQITARSAAAQRVAAAKAAAASASRASLAKTPRSRAPVTPSASRPSLPPQLAARSAAAQRVAAAKAAAASASRASLAKTPRPLLKPPPKAPTAKTPAVRKASQKYVAGTDAVKLRTLAKQEYERAIAAARRDVQDEEELIDHLDYLKDEYKAQLDFVNKLEVEKLKEKAKYLADAREAKNTIEDPGAQQEALAALEQHLVSRLHKLDEYAGQAPREIGAISEKDIAADVANQERLDRIAERVKQDRKKAAAQEAAKARKAKQEAEAKEMAKSARMAAFEERRKSLVAARKTPSTASVARPLIGLRGSPLPGPSGFQKTPATSRASLALHGAKSMPRMPKTPDLRVRPPLPISVHQAVQPVPKKTVHRRALLREKMLESREVPAKTPAKTASQRYIGTDLVKLRGKAKEAYQQDARQAKQVANNDLELAERLKQAKDKYQSKLTFINNLETAKFAAKAKYLVDVKEATDAVADPSELKRRLGDLRQSLVATMKGLDQAAGIEVAATPIISDVQIAQEVARRQTLARDRRERKKAEAQALAEAEQIAARIARSRVSIVPARTPARSVSRVTIKAPSTMPQQKKSVLQMAKTPSMFKQVQPPRMVHRKKPLPANIEKFLRESKPPTPKKPVAKKASEKYIAGTDTKQLNAKAKEEYDAQKELAKRMIVDEDDYKDHLMYLEDEYGSKLHFIKNMDTYKASAHQKYLKDVQAARTTVRDNDVLKERLDHLKDELKNKQAYIEEAAGMPRKPTFRSPTAEVRQEIGNTIHRLTAVKRPRRLFPAPPSRPLETPKGRPSIAGKHSRVALIPPTAPRPTRAKTPVAPAALPIVERAVPEPIAQDIEQRAPSRNVLSKAANEASRKYIEAGQALMEPKPKRSLTKKVVLRKKTELPPNRITLLEEERAKKQPLLPPKASKRYLTVPELNYYKGKAKLNYEQAVEAAMMALWNEEELAKQLKLLKKKYQDQLTFIDGLPERKRKAEEKLLEERQRIEELYSDDPQMLHLHLQLIEEEYKTNLSQLNEEVRFHRKPRPSKFEELNKRLLEPPRRELKSKQQDTLKSRVALPGNVSKVSIRRPIATEKADHVSTLFKTPAVVQPQKASKYIPHPPRRLVRDELEAGRKPLRRKATTPLIPTLQARKSTTPIKSLQKARPIPKSAPGERKIHPRKLKGKNVREAQEKTPAAAAQSWKVPLSARTAIKMKRKLESSLKKMEVAVESNKELLEAIESPDQIQAPISKTSLEPLAVRMGLEPEQQVDRVLKRATEEASALKKKMTSIQPTVAESVQQKDHSTTSPLAAEEADGIFKMMMDEEEGVNLSGEPREIVRLIVPSEGPTLPVTGNAVESLSKGVITDQVPVREINALSDRNAEEFASTVKQQPPHKFPVESMAAKRLQTEQIEVPPATESHPKEDYLQHDLLLHSFEVENFFQSRGSTFPKWFPGIYTVFPEESPKLVLKKSPSEVLHRAWQIMKPKFVTKSP